MKLHVGFSPQNQNVPLLVVEYTAGFPCRQFILTLQKKKNHSLSPAPPFLYTSHVRTTRVRTHDVTGYNLTLTSGTRRVRKEHDVTPPIFPPYHVTSDPRWGGNTTNVLVKLLPRLRLRRAAHISYLPMQLQG